MSYSYMDKDRAATLPHTDPISPLPLRHTIDDDLGMAVQ